MSAMMLSRRRLLGSTALVLGGFAVMGASCNVNVATLAPTVVEYVANIASALGSSLSALGSISGLPASWSATLATITTLVGDIKSVAAGITTSTLVSTAGGSVVNLVNDFNQIVQSILANPVIQAAVSATGFGWALSAAAVLLPLVEAAVDAVVNIVTPPAPTPTPAVPASMRMGAQVGAAAPALDPNTANLILQEIAASR